MLEQQWWARQVSNLQADRYERPSSNVEENIIKSIAWIFAFFEKMHIVAVRLHLCIFISNRHRSSRL
jgi:hypothetical protein